MATITDQHMIVLLGIRDSESYRGIAETLGRAIGTVQILVSELDAMEMIYKPHPDKKEAKPWRITPTGKKCLEAHGYAVFA
jgi:hypothetical protein